VILDVSPAAEPGPASNALFVERFLTYVRHERALADNTLQAYSRDLRDFSNWLGGRSAAAITIRDLGDYLAHLSRKGLARGERGATGGDPARCSSPSFSWRAPSGRARPESLAASAPRRYHARAAGRRAGRPPPWRAPSGRSPTGQRDKALLELLYATGCRASEVSSLKVSDIHLTECFCTCHGKGNKERVVPLGRVRSAPSVPGSMATVAPTPPAPTGSPWVMLSSRGNRLSRMRIWEIVT
jgi:integrase/recombinase XerD